MKGLVVGVRGDAGTAFRQDAPASVAHGRRISGFIVVRNEVPCYPGGAPLNAWGRDQPAAAALSVAFGVVRFS